MAEAGASRSSPAATTRCSSGPCVGLWRCAVVRWRRKLGYMAGRDVLRGRRWRRVGVGTAAAQGGWEGRGMARVMLGAGAAVRQRWLGSAARSTKTAVMRGPKKCSRWSVRARPLGRVLVRAMEPVVTRCAAARQWILRRSCLGAAGHCSGRGAAACVTGAGEDGMCRRNHR